MVTKILIVDEDDDVLSQLQGALTKQGYQVLTTKNGKEGMDLALREHPDLIILEAVLPELDGFSVCKSLRADGFKSPIIFVTKKTSEIDAVIGLELGAQDYIRKPLPLKELFARIEVHLKKKTLEVTNKIMLEELEIDLEKRKVRHRGEVKKLTHKEFQLLYALAQCPNKVFSRNELLNNVWGWSQYGQTRTVDIHIGYLRKKLEDNPRKPKLLQTIRGVGYTFNLE
jgi:two-component system alkaline phosphatase synthesis response regulator PhoP